MVTIVLTACPAGLRGHLTRWMEEVSPGVFVGNVNARLRDRLWELVVEMVGNGRALMAYSTHVNEQGYAYRVHRHDWEPVDIDGVTLIRRPRKPAAGRLRKGWSSASRRRWAKRKRT